MKCLDCYLFLTIFVLPYSDGCLPCAKDKIGKTLMPLFDELNNKPEVLGQFYTTEAPIASGWRPPRYPELPMILSQKQYNKLVESKVKIKMYNVPADAAAIRLWTAGGNTNNSNSWEYDVQKTIVPLNYLSNEENKLFATLLTRNFDECSTKLVSDGSDNSAVAHRVSSTDKCIHFCTALKCLINIDWRNECDKKAKPANISMENGQTNNFYGRLNATAGPIFNDDDQKKTWDGLNQLLLAIGCPGIAVVILMSAAFAVCKIFQKRRKSGRQKPANKTNLGHNQAQQPKVPEEEYESVCQPNEYSEVTYNVQHKNDEYINLQSNICNRAKEIKPNLDNIQARPLPTVPDMDYENLYVANDYTDVTYIQHKRK